MAKSKKKYKIYFNTFVLNKFLSGEKITVRDYSFIAKKINASATYVKSEIKFCKTYLKKRLFALRHNPKLTGISTVYNIPIENLIKLVLTKDLFLTKRKFESFERILKETQGLKSPEKKSYAISDINAFVQLLNLSHKPDEEVVRSGKIKDGTDFYSNKEIYNTLKKYWDAFGVDIVTLAQTEKLRIELINQFRNKGLLAKKINKGFFSNSFIVLNEKGRKVKKYGVFLKSVAGR